MVNYRHFKFLSSGGFSLAYRITACGVEYASAYCSKKDKFSRHIGHFLSLNRLYNSAERKLVHIFNESDPVLLILMDIITRKEYPDSMERDIQLTLCSYILCLAPNKHI